MAGKLIVIDGCDGTGKKTQSHLLIAHLEKIGRKAKYISFPRYRKPSSSLVDDYLNGKFGPSTEVNSYATSIFFAVDRYAASFEMRKLLAEGIDILCDRYVSSNMGHQSAMIDDMNEKDKYIDWVYDLEFNIFNLPKPDAIIILRIAPEISQHLVEKRDLTPYLGENKRDILESDIKHQRNAEQSYNHIAMRFGWQLIDCSPNNILLTRDEIHQMIWNVVRPIIEK